MTTSAAASKMNIKPFTVCNTVKLGPLLPSINNEKSINEDTNFLQEAWSKVEKNKSSNDPTKIFDEKEVRRNKRRKLDSEEEQQTGNQESTTTTATTKPTTTVIEAMSRFENKGRFKDCVPISGNFDAVNLLARAVHTAFYEHYPLRLSPDVIWLTILQGLAKHIDHDPEVQRKNFVDFEGQRILVVSRPEFVKGSTENDWSTVFPEFANMIESCIGKEKVSVMTCDFSTSTPTDRICSHIALMDTVKHYFKYMMRCGCGIPSIELTGTADDWKSLREKAKILCQFDDLEWWTNELFPVLDKFVDAANGKPDIKFWKSVCNLFGGSGFWSDYVTGWIQVFFPYLTAGIRSQVLGHWRKCYEKGTGTETEDFNDGIRPAHRFPRVSNNCGSGLELKYIPVGVSQAPFVYSDFATEKKYDMTFNAGIVAILQNTKTRALEPVTGWAVLDHGEM